MPILFIGATGDRAGHSLVTWALARRLVDRGLNVGFIKPFGTDPIRLEGTWTDRDAYLMKQVLGLQEPLDRICPHPHLVDQTWQREGPAKILDEIMSLARVTSREKDILLIMGSKHIFFDDASNAISDIFFNTGLKSDFLLVHRYRMSSKTVYTILSLASLLGDPLKGIIFNRVPPGKLEEVTTTLMPLLEQKGVPITATIPEDPSLSYRSLGEIMHALDGEFLCGEENLEKPVGGMTAGSFDLTRDLRILKRVYNKIILLAPPSSDLAMDKYRSSRKVVGILLTGGIKPASQVFQIAKGAGIPLILIKADTFTALDHLEQEKSTLSLKDELKVRRLTELLDREDALDRQLRALGLFS